MYTGSQTANRRRNSRPRGRQLVLTLTETESPRPTNQVPRRKRDKQTKIDMDRYTERNEQSSYVSGQRNRLTSSLSIYLSMEFILRPLKITIQRRSRPRSGQRRKFL